MRIGVWKRPAVPSETQPSSSVPPSSGADAGREHMVAVACAGWGVSRSELADMLGTTSTKLSFRAANEESLWEKDADLEDLYLSAPGREQIEALGLHIRENATLCLRALKRNLNLTQDELSEMVTGKKRAISAHLAGKHNLKHLYVKRLAELCGEHEITAEVLRQERLLPAKHYSSRKRKPADMKLDVLIGGTEPRYVSREHLIAVACAGWGITETALAKTLGVSRNSVLRWKNRRSAAILKRA